MMLPASKRLLLPLLMLFTQPALADIVLLSDPAVPQYKEALEAAQKVTPEASFADQSSPDAANQLKHADVVLAIGQKALDLARATVPDKPIVYAMVLAADAQPGKSVTGVALEVPPFAQFAQWKQMKFDATRVGAIYNPKESAAYVDEAGKAAGALGLTLVTRPVSEAKDVKNALADLAGKVDVLWLVPDPRLFTNDMFRFILGFTLDHKIALLGFLDTFTQAGAVASMSPDYKDIGRRAMRLASGIASRPPEQRLPVPAPMTSPGTLTINLKSAKQLGIDMPDSLINKARQVYR
jgi:putative tryptophan/tyrosine transport system substrate-binding protein